MGRLWVFGDFLVFPKLQNRAMEKILLILERPISCDQIEVAYEHSADNSALRRVVLEEAVEDAITGSDRWHDREDVDRIGAIPGFFYDFRARLEGIRSRGYFAPSEKSDKSEYMVEKAQD